MKVFKDMIQFIDKKYFPYCIIFLHVIQKANHDHKYETTVCNFYI